MLGVRQRLLSVCAVFGLGAGLTFYFRGTIMAVLFAPAGGLLSPTGQPIFTAPTEIFQFAVNLALIGGAVCAVPLLAFHVAALLSPLMGRSLRRSLAIFLPAAGGCYLLGAAFAYWVMLPTGFRFLLSFADGAAVAYIRVQDYFDLAVALILWMGVIFELPLAMFWAVRLGVVRYERLKRMRKYVAPTAVILGAIITPTVDAVNLFLVAVPIWALWEAGMVLALAARPRRPRPALPPGEDRTPPWLAAGL